MTPPFKGRRQPYTERGIARVPCAGCGAPSTQQWGICANGNRYMGLCDACDIRINEVVLTFMAHAFTPAEAMALMKAYRLKMLSQLLDR